MSDASNPSHHHHHHHHGGGNKDLVQLKAIAVSEGAKLFVSVVDDQNSQGTIGTHTNKETLTFFGDYDTEAEKNLTDVEKAELEKKREANGVLVFQPPGFEAGDFSKFKATKVENPIKPGDYEVIITFTGSKKVGGIQVQHSAEFKGEGDIRVGEGLGVWRMAVRNPNK